MARSLFAGRSLISSARAQGSARNIGPSACLPREVKTMHAICLHLPYLEGLLPLLRDVETTPSSLERSCFNTFLERQLLQHTRTTPTGYSWCGADSCLNRKVLDAGFSDYFIFKKGKASRASSKPRENIRYEIL